MMLSIIAEYGLCGAVSGTSIVILPSGKPVRSIENDRSCFLTRRTIRTVVLCCEATNVAKAHGQMTSTASIDGIRAGRRVRADGERSRRAILEAATQLATLEGLDRLSIGDLAAHIGMSKSGLYAHFRSKEELQLATIGAAEVLFDEVVVDPVRGAEPGIPSVIALADSFLDHLGARVFLGGCFFACASAEFQSKDGPVKDRIAAFDRRWRARFDEHLEIAKAAGDLPMDEDIDQLFFE